MKTRSPALATAQSAQTRTTTWCWKATRQDGTVLAVTMLSESLLFEGDLYLPRYGFNPRALGQEASAAVANSQVSGYLSDQITELEFEAGKWDGCTVEMFELNYRDITAGKMRLATFTMGNIKVTRSAFEADVNGLTQKLQKIVGRVVTKGCPWVFGSISPDNWTPACNKALGPLTVTGTLTAAPDRRTLIDTSRSEANDYFGGGVLTFTSGANAGDSLEISSYDSATKTFVTYMPYLHNPAVGDTYSLTPGCRKRFTEDCRSKWANTNNHGGFDAIPGPDKVIGLGGTEGSSL
jgi:uncharacterized phage protein (TIGR02218 family)